MAPSHTRVQRSFAFVLVAAVIASTVLLAACGPEPVADNAGLDHGGVVDVDGVRFEIPEDYVVQDREGRVDGELACPSAPGFVFVGRPVNTNIYTDATCATDDDDVIIIYITTLDHPEEYFGRVGASDPRRGSVNGFEYGRPDAGSAGDGFDGAYIREPPLWVSVSGPDASKHLDSLLASLRPSPDDGTEVVPTTAEAVTEVSDRLADELGCDSTERATTYSRADYSPILGRQAEAPVDCYVDSFGFRLIVLRDAADRGLATDYYRSAYLVVDDDWLVTAMSADAATFANERVGGEIIPPTEECCYPPTSDNLPG